MDNISVNIDSESSMPSDLAGFHIDGKLVEGVVSWNCSASADEGYTTHDIRILRDQGESFTFVKAHDMVPARTIVEERKVSSNQLFNIASEIVDKLESRTGHRMDRFDVAEMIGLSMRNYNISLQESEVGICDLSGKGLIKSIAEAYIMQPWV